MKIIVLHGEDTAKSYERLTKFIDTAKSRGWEIIYDEFPNTPSLFGAERLIVYKDFKLLSPREIKNFDKFEGTLVIHHPSDLPLTFLKTMPKDFKMEKFEMPKLLFTFLDSLYPGNADRSLKLLHVIIQTEPIELVFFFLVRHFRDLYWVLKDPNTTGFPPWKKQKLEQQAKRFGETKIAHLIEIFALLDIEVKSSKTNLADSLDLIIIKELT